MKVIIVAREAQSPNRLKLVLRGTKPGKVWAQRMFTGPAAALQSACSHIIPLLPLTGTTRA